MRAVDVWNVCTYQASSCNSLLDCAGSAKEIAVASRPLVHASIE